jgi:Protein of unknown function (DUF1232)
MEAPKKINKDGESKRHPATSAIVGILGAISAIYLFNPTLGVFEIIPDNLPIIGNLDEAGAMALLISCLAYFGVDLGSLFGRKNRSKKSGDDVIDVDSQ